MRIFFKNSWTFKYFLLNIPFFKHLSWISFCKIEALSMYEPCPCTLHSNGGLHTQIAACNESLDLLGTTILSCEFSPCAAGPFSNQNVAHGDKIIMWYNSIWKMLICDKYKYYSSFKAGSWIAIPGLFSSCLNPLKSEFIIVIFIHYKPRIAVAILDL